MNKAFLIGNLTRDPELSTIPSGVSVCRFSIAVNRTFASQDGTRETDFFNIVVWRAQGENCAKYLKKGRKVAIVGSIQNRTYDDKDGNKRYVTEIVASDVEFLTAKSEGDGDYAQDEETTAPSRPKKAKPALEPIQDDDMPF